MRMSSLISASAASASPRSWASMKPARAARARSRSPRPPRGKTVADRRPRPLERAVDRRDAELQHLGDLVGRPLEHVAHDQHRPLARRQQLDDGEERELDRLAGDDLLVEQPVRVRLQPGQVLERLDRRQPPALGLDVVEARVGGDPVQPRPQPLLALERLAAAPRPQQRLLHQVLGFVEGAEHPVAVDVQLAAVALGAGAEVRLHRPRVESSFAAPGDIRPAARARRGARGDRALARTRRRRCRRADHGRRAGGRGQDVPARRHTRGRGLGGPADPARPRRRARARVRVRRREAALRRGGA